jgi:SAM-dependent methyltransferase
MPIVHKRYLADLEAGQRAHWERTYARHSDMYGEGPSEPGRHATEMFVGNGVRTVCELGAGQGRDTMAFLRAGLHVHACDFAAEGIAAIRGKAARAGLADRLCAHEHDVRDPLPLADAGVDAVYSHMLLCMAFTTPELERIAAEIRRVLRPGGWHVYTVRHIGDAHCGVGVPRGDNRYEHGGFVVHFFDRELVDRLAAGMELVDLSELEEGELPRRLWRITSHR